MTSDTMDHQNSETESTSMFMSIVQEIFYSPMNLALVAIIAFLVYKIIKDRIEVPSAGSQRTPEPELPKLRRDFTVAELREYDGNQPDGRVLVAVNGNVFDVTKGKRFYGPGGPYASFAGRDASRNLATFSVTANDKDEYDDLSDLTAMEMDSVLEWEMQFKEKYTLVGKLLRKGEQPTNYEDEEEDTDKDCKPNDISSDSAAVAKSATVSSNSPTVDNDSMRKRNTTLPIEEVD
ncbi:membrane-associated progesterone receptor component 1 [Stomoxys calcitrans]|uniref:membrane-associated progesterone receptor component 1 n=1 Tax=Stomoxys calcitrans TaxID=35570 RepID=UPI0027E319F0|nr:membrane-associated progesterone receptor component 1 [Stomoxys calcitrans]XP_013100401.2 membrane-associated progesterone receptor component 1 [Stomoxys calcitrans]